MTLPRKQIALLHVAKRNLGLEDDDYRSILSRFGGANSAAELSPAGFEAVIGQFKALGFRSSWTKRTFGNRPGMASPSQVDLVRTLWREYNGEADPSDASINAWLERYHHVSAVRFIDARKVVSVIAALRAMVARRRTSISNALQTP